MSSIGSPLTNGLLATSQVMPDEVEFVTELRHLPEGWLAVGGLVLVAGLCWVVVSMYRREGRIGASLRVRMGLAVVRCVVLLALAAILLEPVWVRILRRSIDSYTVVLVDDSSSMDLADAYRDASRADRVKRALDTSELAPIRRSALVNGILQRDDRRFIRELARNNRVKWYAFSDEPELVGTVRAAREKVAETSDETRGSELLSRADELSVESMAAGPATNIEHAVRRSLESLGGAPVAAVVVFSDGGFNQGAPAEDTARYARDRGVPIHVIGVGDPSVPRNVRIAEIDAPPNAFQQDPFPVSCRLSANGVEGQTLRVELHERNATAGGLPRLVDARYIRVGLGGAIEPVTFELRQDRVGRFVYTVEVPIVEGETVVDDNSRQATVNVIDARTRVLVVAGGPSWEYRFLSRLLERDDTFDVSCWLLSADYTAVRDGNTIIDHLPAVAEELFEYDVIVLMNPDPEAIDESWCELVDTMVTEHGAGLLFSAGRTFTPEFLRDRSLKGLHDLLPVTLDPEADLVLNAIGHYQLTASPVEVPEPAFGHPVMRLADDAVSTKLLWQGIGDVHWHYPVLREKPAATVLMRHGNARMRNSYGGHVLAALQFVGAGRTGFMAFDGTWRWRRYGVERFDRFWVQLVRHLAEGKLLGGVKRGMMLTDSEEYSLGSAVTVSARLYDRQFKPLKRDQLEARYSIDGETGAFSLTSQADRPGWFEGRFVPDRSGHYQVTLRLPDQLGDDPLEIKREVHVVRPNIEILRPQMDRANLVALAEQSQGGRYFEIDEVGTVPGLIEDLHEEIAVRSRPTLLWDNWMVLVLLLVLLSVEWGVRKWNRML